MNDRANIENEAVDRLEQGDQAALQELLVQNRERLRRMVSLRLDRRLQGRIDASDVIQDAYVEAARRIEYYVRERPMPFFLWLRTLAVQALMQAHRRHLETGKRSARRELSLFRLPAPEASSAMLAAQLVGSLTSPSDAAIRAERKLLIQATLNAMDPLDREIIALRHFEQLTREEIARTLEIAQSTVSRRYVKALETLRNTLEPEAEAREQ